MSTLEGVSPAVPLQEYASLDDAVKIQHCQRLRVVFSSWTLILTLEGILSIPCIYSL